MKENLTEQIRNQFKEGQKEERAMLNSIFEAAGWDDGISVKRVDRQARGFRVTMGWSTESDIEKNLKDMQKVLNSIGCSNITATSIGWDMGSGDLTKIGFVVPYTYIFKKKD